jgi:hypothetical protein
MSMWSLEKTREYNREWVRKKRATDAEWRANERARNNERMKKRWRERPEVREQHRAYILRKDYGITIEEYNALFEKQKGACAICREHQSKLSRPLAVDHDHKTGKVRGLLCDKCNHGLGQFKDSYDSLMAAANYIFNHP